MSRIEGFTIKERSQHAFESGLLADCKFLVGEDKKEVRACRYALVCGSPVFEAMFVGDLSETKPIEVPDLSFEAFKQLIQFMYTQELDINTLEEALDIFAAAHKYQVEEVMEICIKFIKDHLTKCIDVEDLFILMNAAELYEGKLKKIVIEEVKVHASSFLLSPSFLNLGVKPILSILQRGGLNVTSEVEVIHAVVDWAKTHCEKEVLDVRCVLEKNGLWNKLRFLSLSLEQLQNGQIKLELLTNVEMKGIVKCISSKFDIEPPSSICPLSRPRTLTLPHEYVVIGEGRYNPMSVSSGYESSTTYSYMQQKDIILTGVTLVGQVAENKDESHFYDESLEVSLLSTEQTIYARRSFKGKLIYGSKLHIPLQAKKIFRYNSGFVVRITFLVAGHYPVLSSVSTCFKSAQSVGHVSNLSFEYCRDN